MYISSFQLLFYLVHYFMLTSHLRTQCVQKDGMEFCWEFTGTTLNCELKAPTNGWIAVGFNSTDQLTGTNLIMGAAEHGFFKLSDQYILGPGNHQNVIKLGGLEHVSNRNVSENHGATTMTFILNGIPQDQLHCLLEAGKPIHLLLAYSQSDDFNHHSLKRTSLLITL